MSALLETYLTRTAAPAAVRDAFKTLLQAANHADDLVSDMSVFEWCGLNFDKNDVELLKSREGLAVLEVLSRCRDERADDKYRLSEYAALRGYFEAIRDYAFNPTSGVNAGDMTVEERLAGAGGQAEAALDTLRELEGGDAQQ